MKRTRRWLAVILSLALAAGSLLAAGAPAAAADGPTIYNGGFETGTGNFAVPGNEVGGWGAASSSYGAPAIYASHPTRHGEPHGGLQFAVIPAGMSVKAAIKQTVGGLEPDTHYVLSGYYRNEAASTKFTVGVRYFDASHPDVTDEYKAVSNSQTWTRFELPFKTGDGKTEVGIMIVNQSDGGFGYIDDLALTQVSDVRAALIAKKQEAGALRESDYTPATWRTFAAALAAADAALADQNAADAALSEALTALQAAMDGLAAPEPIESYQSPGHTTYYVSMSDGDDANDGLSPQTPWQTIAKVNAATFAPGDRLLFKSGDVWNGDILRLSGSGAAGEPIVVASYGDAAAKPYINAQGKTMTVSYVGAHDGAQWDRQSPISQELSATVYMENEQYWEITGLEISNHADGLPAAGLRNGILIRNDNAGTLNHIYVKDNDVHDVLGDKATKSYWGNAGILYTVEFRDPVRALAVTGDAETKSNYNDILIEGNYVRNVNRQGITLNSRQNLRPEVDNLNTKYWGSEGISDWYASTGVVIRHNYLENIGGDGILPQVTIGAITEYNTVNGFNKRSGGASAGIWAWNADDSLFQFNEAFGGYTTQDGQGYDVDYAQTGTIFQYNYSHDNDGGFILICSPAQDGNIVNGRELDMKTDDAIIRYNISQNEKNRIYMFSGYSDGTLIYNNTHYQAPSTGTVAPVSFWAWGGSYPTSVSFYNNLFQLDNPTVNWGFRDGNAGVEMQNIAFDYNLVYGTHGANEPTNKGEHNIVDQNPLLRAPGTGETRASLQTGYAAPELDGYMLQLGSPAIGAGKTIETAPGKIVETRHRVLTANAGAADDVPAVSVPEPKASNAGNAAYAGSRLPDEVKGGRDYYGNAVAYGAAPNIGAYGGRGYSDDMAAPVTTAATDPATPDGANGWYVSPVRIALSATDEGSGVARTSYSLDDGQTWQAYGDRIGLDGDGEHTVLYRSEDESGLVEEAQRLTVRLDRTAPTIAVTGLEEGGAYAGAAAVTPVVKVEDSVSGVDEAATEIALDGERWASGRPISPQSLAVGAHELRVQARDLAGNAGTLTVRFTVRASDPDGGQPTPPVTSTPTPTPTTTPTPTPTPTSVPTPTPTATPTPTPSSEPGAGASFDDIGGYPWARQAIEALAEKGIVNGVGDGRFAPERRVTRADFVLLLVRALGLTAESGAGADSGDRFADVRPGDYYYEAIEAAAGLGLAQGGGDGRFAPRADISRQDMMVLLERALRLAGKLPELEAGAAADGLGAFKDADRVAGYAAPAIAALVQSGIVQGSGGSLLPQGGATRAEAAVLLFRALTLL